MKKTTKVTLMATGMSVLASTCFILGAVATMVVMTWTEEALNAAFSGRDADSKSKPVGDETEAAEVSSVDATDASDDAAPNNKSADKIEPMPSTSLYDHGYETN